MSKTQVIFKKSPGADSEIIAFFDPQGYHKIPYYAHIGQHGEVSPSYFRMCSKATPEEYADLKAELERIGYDLEVRQRFTHRKG
jgi:hypothetical protein